MQQGYPLSPAIAGFVGIPLDARKQRLLAGQFIKVRHHTPPQSLRIPVRSLGYRGLTPLQTLFVEDYPSPLPTWGGCGFPNGPCYPLDRGGSLRSALYPGRPPGAYYRCALPPRTHWGAANHAPRLGPPVARGLPQPPYQPGGGGCGFRTDRAIRWIGAVPWFS